MRRLGADVVIDYRKDDFVKILKDYDLVLDTQGGEVLEKSLQVLNSGGKVIGIAGPPHPDFAKCIGWNWLVGLVVRLLSRRIRKKAKRHHVSYSFLLTRPIGLTTPNGKNRTLRPCRR